MSVKNPDPYSDEALRAEYASATAELAEIEKRVAPLRARLAAAADAAEAARVSSMAVRRELDTARGGDAFFALKRKIGRIAKMLGGQ